MRSQTKTAGLKPTSEIDREIDRKAPEIGGREGGMGETERGRDREGDRETQTRRDTERGVERRRWNVYISRELIETQWQSIRSASKRIFHRIQQGDSTGRMIVCVGLR